MSKKNLINKVKKVAGLSFLGLGAFSKASAQSVGNIGSEAAGNSNVVGNNLQLNIGGGGLAVDPVVPTGTVGNNQAVFAVINTVDKAVNAAFIILIGIIFVLFMWNLVHYLRTKEEAYQKAMVRDFVILFVAVAIWGIIQWVAAILGTGIGGTGVRTAI